MRIFEYSEVCIVQSQLYSRATFRVYGDSYQDIDLPFDYMKKLGNEGWEMVNVATAGNDNGSIKIYTFKREP